MLGVKDKGLLLQIIKRSNRVIENVVWGADGR